MSIFTNEIIKYISLLLIFSMNLYAGTTGKIVGKVTDENGNALIGCNVIVKGTSLGAATNQNGEYFILNVPPGYYQVSASMIGYGGVTIKDLQVIVDLTAKANFRLNTESIEGEEVVVVAETPTVRLDQTSMAAVISADDIENLPVSEISDLIELQAGVVKDESGGFHVRGGRSGEVSFWVDGISTTDAYDNSSGLEIENSGVQEIQVISGTFNAEYGQAMSGIVNVVTKDGSENFEGSLNLYSGGFTLLIMTFIPFLLHLQIGNLLMIKTIMEYGITEKSYMMLMVMVYTMKVNLTGIKMETINGMVMTIWRI